MNKEGIIAFMTVIQIILIAIMMVFGGIDSLDDSHNNQLTESIKCCNSQPAVS